jgi:sodium pump decarboxylase gamma subunit
MSTVAFGLTLLVVGMGGTLLALWLLTLLIRGLTALFPPTREVTPTAASVATLAVPPPPVAVATATETVPAATLAVIIAAVHATHEGRARIVGVTPQGDNQGWSLEGRRAILHSHKVR